MQDGAVDVRELVESLSPAVRAELRRLGDLSFEEINEEIERTTAKLVRKLPAYQAALWGAPIDAEAAVRVRGMKQSATMEARCSFQPYTQPCHPDLPQSASTSRVTMGS